MLADRTTDLRPEDLKGRRCASYIRESTRAQADRYGPDLQRAEQRRYAERYGLLATGLEYLDLVSGKDTLRRTDFQRMLADAEAGLFDILLCYDTSRFARNPADHYVYLERLAKLGISVVFCADGLIAGNTDTYELQGMKAVSDAGYLRRLSRNVTRGYNAKWERHNDPGGRPPLGFARTGPERLLTPVEGPELETVRKLFALYATGTESDFSLGGEFGLSEFRVEEILQNPLYAGRAVRHKGKPDEEERLARFAAPVHPALFERVQQIRIERRTRHSAGGGSVGRRPYPLVSLLSCARCGCHYHGDATNGIRRIRHVRRPSCTSSLTERADRVELQVAKLLDAVRLSDADVEAVLQLIELPAPEPARDEARIAERKAELQRQLAAGTIRLEHFTREWRQLERPVAISTHLATAQQLSRARELLRDFGSLWRDVDLPASLKEQAAKEIFNKIELDGPAVVAVYPREEHAWLLGMHAKKAGLLGMVGARGFEPPTS